MTRHCQNAISDRGYPATAHWSHLTKVPHWADQLRLLARAGTEWQFERHVPDGKILASYKPHRGLEQRINKDEEEFRDRLPYQTIQWTAKFEDGSGWHGSVSLQDWCKLAWRMRSVHDNDNQVINWLWIKVKERAAD